MRVYHFTTAHWALDDILHRRIKIAEYRNCNDPFELGCFVGRNREVRLALRLFKDEMREKFGFVSFSRSWKGTLLWSHYAEQHKGICLGFDLKEGLADKVQYPKARPIFPVTPTEDIARVLLLTKAPGWAYEEEWRVSASLNKRDPDAGLYFYPFGDDFRLREVIVGACTERGISEGIVRNAIGSYPYPVSVKKARLGFKRFEVVLQKRGFEDPISKMPLRFRSKYSETFLRHAADVGYQEHSEK